MPLITGIVGPVPEGRDAEEYDKLRRRVMWTMPSGLFVIGSRAGERRNAMTANWVSQVSSDPKLISVAVEKEAVTHELIAEGKVFSVNIVDREDRAIIRKFTKPVEVDAAASTLNGFPFHEGPPAPPCSTRPSPGSTAGSTAPSTWAPTPCSSARWSTPASRSPRTPPSCAWRTPA